jgi:hypothetical protein
LNDYEIIKGNKTIKFNLTKGFHVLLWQYAAFNEYNQSSNPVHQAKIFDIIIDGIEDNEYGCRNLSSNLYTEEEESNKCDINYYFNRKEVICF